MNALLTMVAQWQVEAKFDRPIRATGDSEMMMKRALREGSVMPRATSAQLAARDRLS